MTDNSARVERLLAQESAWSAELARVQGRFEQLVRASAAEARVLGPSPANSDAGPAFTPRMRVWRRVALPAAAATLVFGLAAAMIRHAPTRLSLGAVPAAPPPARAPVANTAAAALPARPVEPPAARSAQQHAVTVERELSASDLFKSANDARRNADYARALQLYSELQSRFPNTAEAGVSRATTGRLLLDVMHTPSAALLQFQEYLARYPRGTLAEQALAGRALALEKLARRVEEQRAWGELLRRFPDSPHAAHARARMLVP